MNALKTPYYRFNMRVCTYGLQNLSAGDRDWQPDWQTTDVTPPSSYVTPLPAVSPGLPITITWSISESLWNAGDYNVQVRQGLNGAWTSLPLNVWRPFKMFSGGVGGQTYYFRGSTYDWAFNDEPWPPDYDTFTTIENLPPISAMLVLPAYSKYQTTLQWHGDEIGGSILTGYDIQYRAGQTGTWTNLLTNTTQLTVDFAGELGHTYYFRTRATDSAFNTENWPITFDAKTKFYAWAISGTVRDNTGVPVSGAEIALQTSPLLTITSDMYGVYDWDVFLPSEAYTPSWNKVGYGFLPATPFGASTGDSPLTTVTSNPPPVMDAHLDVVLPPADNIIINGHFEEADLAASGWYLSPEFTPRVVNTIRHTGKNSVVLEVNGSPTGVSSIAQVVTLPLTLSNPVLSFMERTTQVNWLGDGGTGVPSFAPHAVDTARETFTNHSALGQPFTPHNGSAGLFFVQVDDGLTTTIVFSNTPSVNTWAHHWLDLSAWTGQAITITWYVQQGANTAPSVVYLDDISLGSSYPDIGVNLIGPSAAKPGDTFNYHLSYGNHSNLPATQVQLAFTPPADVTILDSSLPPMTTTAEAWVWELETLPAQTGPATLVLTATVAPTATMWSRLDSTATLTSTSTELELLNNLTYSSLRVAYSAFFPVIRLDP